MTKHESMAIAYWVSASVLQRSLEGRIFRDSLNRLGFAKEDITAILAEVPAIMTELENTAYEMAPNTYPMRVRGE